MWAYLGINDAKSKLRVKGVQSHFNPEVSGRFWLLMRNVLLHQDVYYTAIYHTMKSYYWNRPDMYQLAEMKHEENPESGEMEWVPKKKGWRGHVDNMARRFVWKLLISHGVQIILESYGEHFPTHHNFIPPKPIDLTQAMRIADMFNETRVMLLERQKKSWDVNHEILIGRDIMSDPIYDMGFGNKK